MLILILVILMRLNVEKKMLRDGILLELLGVTGSEVISGGEKFH